MANRSAAEFTEYLIRENGWTRAEVEVLLALSGTDTRPEAEWFLAIDEYGDLIPNSLHSEEVDEAKLKARFLIAHLNVTNGVAGAVEELTRISAEFETSKLHLPQELLPRDQTDETYTTRCKRCNRPIHFLSIFPGDRCLDCHSRAFSTQPKPSAKQVADAFRNPLV